MYVILAQNSCKPVMWNQKMKV